MIATIALLALFGSSAFAAPPSARTVVFCSPGAPGTTAEAQPTMDAFAAALAERAGLSRATLAAVYEATEDACVKRLRSTDAAVAIVSLPFFLKHERELALRPRLQPVAKGREPLGRWALFAKKGRAPSADALGGFTIVSTAGFAPAFVRGPGVGRFGPLPAGVRVTPSSAVLSALRRAAAGEDVAVLLDAEQAAALPSLPFAADLEPVARSEPLPQGIAATVGAFREKDWSVLDAALRSMPPDVLDAIRTSRFEAVNERALAAARTAHAEAAR
jgi:hypothetical protein